MASIYDIAKAAGVSSATVSLIMNNKGDDLRIAQKTQERVRQVARDLGYVPNVNARKLISRQMENVPEIGLLWSPTQHPVFLNAMISKMNELKNRQEIGDMNVTIYPFENEHIEKQAKILSGNFVHGLIVPIADEKDIAYMEQLDIRVPVIVIYWETGKYCTVNVDNDKNGRIACEIFHGLGYRRVGIVESGYYSVSSEKRMNSFRQRCRELGMELLVEKSLGAGSNSKPKAVMNLFSCGKDFAEQIIREQTVPQGIFTQDDDIARGVIRGLEKHGLKVPEDAAVICYGHNSIENRENNDLTLITYPIEVLTEKTWQLMNRLIYHKPLKERQVFCESPVYFGRSCPRPERFEGLVEE
ncbi:MAG: LacI family transcriptional regulator [Lachnospiraceae bacterium]|nr:LacI family transcriptional regulator [Lachnospiraceae bacterium]